MGFEDTLFLKSGMNSRSNKELIIDAMQVKKRVISDVILSLACK